MAGPHRAALQVVFGWMAALLLTSPVLAQGQRTPAQLWEDFNHYVLVARPELAAAAGEALLAADPDAILDAVEASTYSNWPAILDRAKNMEGVRDAATRLEQTIQQARIGRSREQQRILDAIDRLDDSRRAFQNNVAFLRGSGQHAAPALLQTLQDESKAALHPYIVEAIVAIGRPLVYPLSVALPDLEPVTQQQVARALAQVGYPIALPYLKKVLESPTPDATARQTLQTAYDTIAAGVRTPGDVTAATLFYQLGMNTYTAAAAGEKPMGFDPATGKGMVWAYIGPEGGLVATEVPGEIFGDVLAMRWASQALALNPSMDQALSLWLMANLRRENRLPAGQTDPSYPQHLKEPSYYAMLAGPVRQHEVLNRALDDGDEALALDAIDALEATAGPDALVNRDGTVRPLIRALSYPDRRVRFNAAMALAAARPVQSFDEAYRVVPVLAEALRQTDKRYAAVVGRDGQDVNVLQAALTEQGFEVYADTSLDAIRASVANLTGVDLLVVSGDAGAVEAMFRSTAVEYKLATAPVLGVVTPGDQLELARRITRQPRFSTTVAGDPAQFRSAVEAAMTAAHSGGGGAITDDEAQAFALRAAGLLELTAIENKGVFNPMDAQPALIEALSDPRLEVAVAAAAVLAKLDSEPAQRAIASTALASKDARVQVPMLISLAASANTFGNRLEQPQTDALLELVRTAEGDVALAAARAHGALSLPTSNAVDLLLGPKK